MYCIFVSSKYIEATVECFKSIMKFHSFAIYSNAFGLYLISDRYSMLNCKEGCIYRITEETYKVRWKNVFIIWSCTSNHILFHLKSSQGEERCFGSLDLKKLFQILWSPLRQKSKSGIYFFRNCFGLRTDKRCWPVRMEPLFFLHCRWFFN